jgi:hypothetical protein
MKMEQQLARGQELLHYDHYYTTGVNIGTAFSTAPSAGIPWRPLFHPVATGIFSCSVASPEAPFTTVMNWQSYEPLEYRGFIYGHKDVEFGEFLTLPGLTSARFELAVAGKDVPTRQLRAAGWGLADAHEVTISFNSFVDYIRSSRGEFGVCKSGFVRTQCGWFSDRSAAYLATGRPVVLQDTGFSARLPCGQGLFAVRSVEEAAAAAEAIAADYAFHARRAREVAEEFLEARVVLGRFLDDLGI